MIDLSEWTLGNVRDSLRDSVVSNKLGYLYMPLGKAANTEIKRLLWDIECANGYGTAAPLAYFAVHNKSWTKSTGQSPSPWQCYKEMEISRFLDDTESKFLFSVVRPYLKLLSGYFDKVVNTQQEKDPEKRDAKMIQHNLPSVPESFEEFVEIVCQQSNDETNIHWTGQRFALLYDFLDYDYIGSLEDLQETFGFLSEKFAFSSAQRENIAVHRTSAIDKFSQNYTPDLMAKVYRRYREDFDTFGYEPEPLQGTFNPVGKRSTPGTKKRFARLLGEMTVELRARRHLKVSEILSTLRVSAGCDVVIDSRFQKALSSKEGLCGSQAISR